MFPDRWGSDYDYAEAHGNFDQGKRRVPRHTFEEAIAAFWRVVKQPQPPPRVQADDPQGLAERRWSQR